MRWREELPTAQHSFHSFQWRRSSGWWARGLAENLSNAHRTSDGRATPNRRLQRQDNCFKGPGGGALAPNAVFIVAWRLKRPGFGSEWLDFNISSPGCSFYAYDSAGGHKTTVYSQLTSSLNRSDTLEQMRSLYNFQCLSRASWLIPRRQYSLAGITMKLTSGEALRT